MAFPDTPMPLSQEAQAAVVQYYKSTMSLYTTTFNIRNQLMMRDLAYYREEDRTKEQVRAKMANDTGDSSKTQNITVPVVMPQTESALGYLTGVFLTGFPIFGSVAPPDEQEAMAQFDAINGDNQTRLGWVPNLMQCMRDGLKYDMGIVEVQWKKSKIFSVDSPNEKNLAQGTAKTSEYEGNEIRRLDPYNTILDPRVAPDENHLKGEFAGYTEMLSRVETLKRMADLDKTETMNFKKALESGTTQIASTSADVEGFFIPTINPDALVPAGTQSEFDWLKWAKYASNNQGRIAYQNSYLWTVMYARIIPRDFGIRGAASEEIQIWKFLIINSQVVIHAKRMTNAHNLLPIIVCKPSNDGMGYQSKSFAENVIPFQRASTSLLNSALASQRRKVYDRILYDPTRVRKEDIDRVDPVSRIPVRNTQMGKGLADAVSPMTYNDNGVAEILQMSQQITQMGEVVNGQNRVQQGQFQKGNKTRREFETVMGNANARQQMQALALESNFFQPIKTILISNVLQYQPPTSILNEDTGDKIEVDPFKLRTALIKFKLSDGLLTTEKIASLDIADTVLQMAAAMPQLQMEYDVMGMLNYMYSLQGVHWLKNFKRTPEQIQEWASNAATQTAATGGQNGQSAPPAKTPDAGAAGAI